MRRIAILSAAIATLVMACLPILATTWVPEQKTCPICATKTEFMEIMSYGGYIYDWPTKYQYFFWPKTDKNFLFCCPKCHYCAYMWDFEDLPKDKAEAIKKVLEGTALRKKKHYYDIPMTERLDLAEKVYALLDKPDNFWCDFYRVKGYWFEKEKNRDAAAIARKKALALAETMCADPTRETELKALLFIAGSMKYFTDDKDGALVAFNKALPLQYKHQEMTAEKNKNTDEFLNALLKDFITRLTNKETIPRD